MTRCSVDGWWPFCIRFDEPPRYSENDLSGIIEAVGRLPDGDIEYHSHYEDAVGWITISMPRREGLAKMLENAAEAYFIYKCYGQKPTPKQLEEKLKIIETAASKLLSAMSLSESIDADAPLAGVPHLIRSALQAGSATEADRLGGLLQNSDIGLLENAVRGAYHLRDWARAAGELHRRDERTPRHEGDPALDRLFRELFDVYRMVFEREPGTSIDTRTGEPTGPWVRFVKACLRPILAEAEMPTDTAIRERTRRVMVKSTSEKTLI